MPASERPWIDWSVKTARSVVACFAFGLPSRPECVASVAALTCTRAHSNGETKPEPLDQDQGPCQPNHASYPSICTLALGRTPLD